MLQSTGLQRVRYDLATEQQQGFPGGTSGKEPSCQHERHKRWGLNPWIGNIPWRRAWQPTPVFLSGESHGQRSLVGYMVHRISKCQTWLKQLCTHGIKTLWKLPVSILHMHGGHFQPCRRNDSSRQLQEMRIHPRSRGFTLLRCWCYMQFKKNNQFSDMLKPSFK